ncbi:unnamed protein product [Cladocopium goreaui]|uniref:DNA (Cytosine-5-)-methyltransferase n=1 Tax=Cladocopium goreaui TaxID=2562237 RepID=A0A9P1GJA9_9DINO|nr:unnamed protein product [Cladocopium goreaui]
MAMVSMGVLDAQDYGLPQRRRRLWIVGVNTNAAKGKFTWPKPIRKKVKLSEVLGRKSNDMEFPSSSGGRKRLREGLRNLVRNNEDAEECWVIDCAASRKFAGKPSFEVSPTLTRARGGAESFWVTSHNRFMTLEEKALVQGWKPMSLKPDDLSARELGMALGNAWPLSVSAKLIEQLNKCMGWQPKD